MKTKEADNKIDTFLIRHVSTRKDLIRTFDYLGGLFDPPFNHENRSIDDLLDHFPEDRQLMFKIEKNGIIISGAFYD